MRDEAAPLEVVEEGGVEGHLSTFRFGALAGKPAACPRGPHSGLPRSPAGCPGWSLACRGDRRQVRARARDRSWRHGRGVAGARHDPRSRGGDQAGRPDAGRRRRRPGARRARGPAGRAAQPPPRRRGLRPRQRGRRASGSSWSTSRGRPSRRWSAPRARCRRTGPRRCSDRRPTRSPRPTRPASSTATSSPPTCWWAGPTTVKLSDFGIARAEADASLTQTGLVTGSPAYLSPEVASGPRRPTRATSGRSARRSTTRCRASRPTRSATT